MAQLPEDIRLAVFGYNPRTGEAFTEEESRAINGGYLPENYNNIVEYSYDENTKTVSVTNAAGMTSSLGAKFKPSFTGAIVPDMEANNLMRISQGLEPYMDAAYDEAGVPVQYSETPTGQAIDEALNNRSWLSYEDPQQALAELGKIVSKYAKPGTDAYTTAMLSAAQMGSRSHQDIQGNRGTLANYLNGQISYEQGLKLGINTVAAGIGRDAGASFDPAGNIMRTNDPYMRDRYNNIMTDPDGTPVLKPRVGDIVDPNTGRAVDLAKLEFVPSWVVPSAEMQAAGIIPGAKIDKNMLANFESIRAVTGKGTSVPKWMPMGSTNLTTGNRFTGSSNQYGSFVSDANLGDMTAKQQDTYSSIVDRLNKYNLGGLAPLIKKLAIQGATEATIMLRLQDEPIYQDRFKANKERIKRGIAVLSPAEYLTLEDDYRQVLRSYGLTQFDTDAYVSQFIANDMSVSELSNRVVTAVQRVQNADPAVSRMLKDYYGIGDRDLVAYALDPSQQFAKIERQIATSEIGVAAAKQGIAAGKSVAEQLAAQGISADEAMQGYASIASLLPTAEKLSDIYGTTLPGYGLAEAEQERFNLLASAQRKRQNLAQREVAEFSGQSGVGRTSLGGETRGQF